MSGTIRTIIDFNSVGPGGDSRLVETEVTPDGHSIVAGYGLSLYRYDIATGAQIGTWSFTHPVGAFSISPDGHYAYVVSHSSTDPLLAAHDVSLVVTRVDLATGSEVDYQTSVFAQTATFEGVVALTNGDVVLSTDAGSTAEPLLLLDPASGTFTPVAGASLTDAVLSASDDHSHILAVPQGTPGAGSASGAPLYLYSAANNTISGSTGSGMVVSPGGQAITSSGSLSAQIVYDAQSGIPDVYVYGSDLHLATMLSTANPEVVSHHGDNFAGSPINGLVFSPDGGSLYVDNGASGLIYKISTTDWSVQAVIPTGHAVYEPGGATSSGPDGGNKLTITPDGQTLIREDGRGVVAIDISGVTTTPVLTDLSVQTATVSGQQTLTISARVSDVASSVGAITIALNQPIATTTGVIDHVVLTPAADGTASATLTIAADAALGSYRVNAVTVADQAGHSVVYDASTPGDAQTLLATFFVNPFSVSDVTAPALQSLTLPTTVILDRQADLAHFAAGVSDAQTGVASASLTLDHAYDSSRPSTNIIALPVDQHGAAANDVLFPANATPGTYTVTGLTVTDHAGNQTTYDEAYLLSRNIVDSFTVIAHDISNDFNGDGHSDILWRNDDGNFTEWQVSGNAGQLTPNTYGNAGVGTDWHVAETFDFNGDGFSDILWRNAETGQFTVWEGATGNSFTQNAYADSSVDTNWQIAAVGDLNGDGREDIVWHNSVTGAMTTWQSTGTAFDENVAVYEGIPTDYQIVGTGDFNGDGKADLLWRDQATGQFTTWTSNGAAFDTNVYTDNSVGTDWHVKAIADFDGDGKSDLLWRNASNGEFTIWTSTGTGFTPNTYVDTSVGTDWQIAQTGDFNDDGKADILWRNSTTGTFTIWQSEGHGFDENVVVQTGVGTDWHVQGHDYLYG